MSREVDGIIDEALEAFDRHDQREARRRATLAERARVRKLLGLPVPPEWESPPESDAKPTPEHTA
jgi:hypothetical protein